MENLNVGCGLYFNLSTCENQSEREGGGGMQDFHAHCPSQKNMIFSGERICFVFGDGKFRI